MSRPLIEMLRLRAAAAGGVLRYAPKLRADLHPDALVWTSVCFAGEESAVHAALAGRRNAEPEFFWIPDPRERASQIRLFAALGDLFSEYFSWCRETGAHPQIVVASPGIVKHLCAVAAFSASLGSERSASFGAAADSQVLERARHFGRLLAYPAIERWGVPGQQSLLCATDLVSDHFALPLSDADRSRFGAAMEAISASGDRRSPEECASLSADHRLLPADENAILEPALDRWSAASELGDAVGRVDAERLVSSFLRGVLRTRHDAIVEALAFVEAARAPRCSHLADLHDYEVRAFGDHVFRLDHYMRRLRRSEGAVRDDLSRRFVDSSDRAFFAVRRFEWQESLHEHVALLSRVHDPVARAEGRLSGSVLSGVVLSASHEAEASLFCLSCRDGSADVAVDDALHLLDHPLLPALRVADSRQDRGSLVVTLRASSHRVLPQVGSSVDLSAEIPKDYASRGLEMVHLRIGAGRGGEHWTHRPDARAPLPACRAPRSNLVALLTLKAGP